MKITTVTIFENILGLILAVFIIFKILPNTSVSREMNNPVYVILFLVFLVILFLTLNPIIGILFLIYGYLLLINGRIDPVHKKQEIMKKMNPEKNSELEEVIIQSSNFTRIKNKDEDKDTRVEPILEKVKVV
jgi:predicted membrane protein